MLAGIRRSGFTAYGMIDRTSGSYELVATSAGVIAAMNDLHKAATRKRLEHCNRYYCCNTDSNLLTALSYILYDKGKVEGSVVAILGTLTFVVLCLLLG